MPNKNLKNIDSENLKPDLSISGQILYPFSPPFKVVGKKINKYSNLFEKLLPFHPQHTTALVRVTSS